MIRALELIQDEYIFLKPVSFVKITLDVNRQ